MNSFGFPNSTNYAQSQVSSNTGHETNYNQVENGGLFTREECRNVVRYFFFAFRKIIDRYDGNGDGICETIEVAKWLVDCYRAMNRSFSPTATDIASYVQIIDKNKNGKVSREELEEFIIRYFFNPNRAV